MIRKTSCFVVLCSLISLVQAQTLTGKIFDAKTQSPLKSVSVYFDNTTIGTATDDTGFFSITYSEAIQSNLIISYLGYEIVIVPDYRNQNELIIEMKESLNQLDEVLIDANDGLTRKQKLKIFRKEFLGFSSFSKSCKILNEADLILRYNKKAQTLSVSAKQPVLVKNKSLKYEIAYDISDFEIEFRYLDAKTGDYSVHSLLYTGTSFYKDLSTTEKRKLRKYREKAFKGSIQHFMRSLYDKNLRGQGFDVFHNRFQVDEWAFFIVEEVTDSPLKKVSLDTKVNILFELKDQSVLTPLVTHFYIDAYGNYSPISEVVFSGVMGNHRIGDLLPTNYGIEND